MMLVSDLINRLRELPQDLPVYVSSDEEGNSIKGLYHVEPELAENPGEYSLEMLDSSYADAEPNVIVLYP